MKSVPKLVTRPRDVPFLLILCAFMLALGLPITYSMVFDLPLPFQKSLRDAVPSVIYTFVIGSAGFASLSLIMLGILLPIVAIFGNRATGEFHAHGILSLQDKSYIKYSDITDVAFSLYEVGRRTGSSRSSTLYANLVVNGHKVWALSPAQLKDRDFLNLELMDAPQPYEGMPDVLADILKETFAEFEEDVQKGPLVPVIGITFAKSMLGLDQLKTWDRMVKQIETATHNRIKVDPKFRAELKQNQNAAIKGIALSILIISGAIFGLMLLFEMMG